MKVRKLLCRDPEADQEAVDLVAEVADPEADLAAVTDQEALAAVTDLEASTDTIITITYHSLASAGLSSDLATVAGDALAD